MRIPTVEMVHLRNIIALEIILTFYSSKFSDIFIDIGFSTLTLSD
jgi:hypothetical protein